MYLSKMLMNVYGGHWLPDQVDHGASCHRPHEMEELVNFRACTPFCALACDLVVSVTGARPLPDEAGEEVRCAQCNADGN